MTLQKQIKEILYGDNETAEDLKRHSPEIHEGFQRSIDQILKAFETHIEESAGEDEVHPVSFPDISNIWVDARNDLRAEIIVGGVRMPETHRII